MSQRSLFTDPTATPAISNPLRGTSSLSTTTAGASGSGSGAGPSGSAVPQRQVETVGLNVFADKIAEGVVFGLGPILRTLEGTNQSIMSLADAIRGGNVAQAQQAPARQTVPATPGGQMIPMGPGIDMTPTPARPGFALTGDLTQPLATQNPQGVLVLQDGSQLQPIQTAAGDIQPDIIIPPGLQALLERANREGLRFVENDLPRELAFAIQQNELFVPIQVLEAIRQIWVIQSQDPQMMADQQLTIPGSEQQWFYNFCRALHLAVHQAQARRPILPLIEAIQEMRLAIEDANRQQGQAQINPGQPPAAAVVDFTDTNERLDRVADTLAQATGLPVEILNASVPIRAVNAQGDPAPLPVNLNYTTFTHVDAQGRTVRALAVAAQLEPGGVVSVQNVRGTSLDVNVVNRVGLDYNDQNPLPVSLGITAANPLPVQMAGNVALNIGDVNAIDPDTRNAIINSADYLNPYRSMTNDQLVSKFTEMGLAHYSHMVATNRELAEKKLNVITEMPELAQHMLDYNQGKSMFADQGFERKSFDIFVQTGRTTNRGVPLEQTYRYLPKSIPEARVKFDGKLYNLTQGNAKYSMKNFRDIEKLALKGGDYAEELETFREIRKGINTNKPQVNIIFKARKW